MPSSSIPSPLPFRSRLHRRWRKLRAGWRDTLLLLRQFASPLALFVVAMVGGGLIYYQLAKSTTSIISNPIEAIYIVLTATFLQPTTEFPQEWYLELFYFLMPIIGIGVLAQGLADFGVLLFNRRQRGKEWNMAVAATMSRHIVLVGLGHLGYRVMKNLYTLGQDVIIVELDPRAELLAQAQALDIPVLHGDGAREEVLELAGIARANTLVICTQNDLLNMQIAFKARKLNNNIQVVARIFDDDFAQIASENFGFRVMSATGIAAPAFASAAAGIDVTPPITIEGESFSFARLDVTPSSRLIKQSVEDVEQKYNVSVVLLRQNGESEFHPMGDSRLIAGDVLGVLGKPGAISRLVNENRRI